MKHTVLIVNPNAGDGSLLSVIDDILTRFRRAGMSVSLHQTTRPGEGARIVRTAAENADLIIAAGGDGTAAEMVNALAPLPRRPRLAILPGGTCNDFSRTLGISQDPMEAAEQILSGRERSVDVGFDGHRYFLNFWGIGLITEVSADINPKEKERFGRLAYYINALKHAVNPTPFTLHLEADDVSYHGPAQLLIAGNGAYLGGYRTFFPTSCVDDGLLDVFLVKEASFDSLWSWIRSHWTGNMPEGEDILYFRTRQLHVKTAPSHLIDCDGEKEGTTPAILSVLPGHLTMLAGDRQTNKS
jgi:YegS/Rv2252/BmrU family lipid kinase